MPTPKEMWACNYCGRVLRTHGKAETHEKTCNKNPRMKSCYTCLYREEYCKHKTNIRCFDRRIVEMCVLWEARGDST